MKDVLGFNGKYSVDTEGNVYSIKLSRVLNGFLNHNGYRKVELWNDGKGKHKFVHRLVWEAYNGPVPVGLEIDHIDRDRLNNNLSNLRLVTRSQNLWNTGAKGYCWISQCKKWRAQITANGIEKYLGFFDTEEEARQAYLNAKEIYHAI